MEVILFIHVAFRGCFDFSKHEFCESFIAVFVVFMEQTWALEEIFFC